MKKCQLCGLENTDDKIICSQCGGRLNMQQLFVEKQHHNDPKTYMHMQNVKSAKNKGVASLIIGIISLIFMVLFPLSLILAIISIVLGIIAISQLNQSNERKGIAIGGVTVSIITVIIMTLIIFFLIFIVSDEEFMQEIDREIEREYSLQYDSYSELYNNDFGAKQIDLNGKKHHIEFMQ